MLEIDDYPLENQYIESINILVNNILILNSLDLTSPPTRYFIRIMSKFTQ